VAKITAYNQDEFYRNRAEAASGCTFAGHPFSLIRESMMKSDKSNLTALLLCLFLGGFGAHRFFVGKVGSGLGMLFTLGGCGIWTLIDIIMIAMGNFTDAEGRKLQW
jgi:hypothetical protein